MMPNLDPRALKAAMSRMGIKSKELNAKRVTIECGDKTIVITEPQVTQVEMQGSISFQVAGSISEEAVKIDIEISEDDINMVKEKTGITDDAQVKSAIQEANGDIAEAIMKLKEQ